MAELGIRKDNGLLITKVMANESAPNLSVFVFALNKDVLEEVVVVLLHLLVGHVGQVGAVSSLK